MALSRNIQGKGEVYAKRQQKTAALITGLCGLMELN
jgi:hypothetical protein